MGDDRSSESVWLRNLMPHRLRLRYTDAGAVRREVVVPPLGLLRPDADAPKVQALIDLGVLAPQRNATDTPSNAEYLGVAMVPAGGAGFVASAIVNGAAWHAFGLPYWHLVVGFAVGALVFVLAAYFAWRSTASDSKVRQTGLTMQHQFMLLLMLVAAVGLPVASVKLLAGDADNWLGPLGVRLGSGDGTGLARILLLAFVCSASAFPGLLYFIFDRKRAEVVRESFENQIFRLDRGIKNLADVHARYGARLRELYGDSEHGGAGSRLRFGTRWPVLIGTCAMAGGWITVLLAPGMYKIVEPKALADGFSAMFTPIASNFAFGFLGAYFFSLQLIARRYARGDLHPKTYSIIAARIFVVLVSAWAIDATVGANQSTYALLFLIGVLPEAIYLALREVVAQKVLGNFFINVTSRLPLTDLPGIDLYDRARLEEEGVTNIENLAHCDLVDLMLSTNVPAPQLIQWVDQAILHLRGRELSDEAPGDEAKASEQKVAEGSLLPTLHRAGVVRASDLVRTCFDDCGKPTSEPNDTVLTRIRTLCGETTAQRAHALADLIPRDQWFPDIAYWRTWQEPSAVIYEVGADGQVRIEPD